MSGVQIMIKNLCMLQNDPHKKSSYERGRGAGIGMGNTCNSMADSCQCMAKTTTIL